MMFKPFGEHLAKINLAFWSFYVINSRFMQKSLCFGDFVIKYLFDNARLQYMI